MAKPGSFFGRPDGVLVGQLAPVRRIMPFVLRRRSESLVWFEQDVEVDVALALADRLSAELGVRVTFFTLVLRAAARIFHEYPRLNRYVVGRRLYQRTDIALSFSGKESFDESAPLYVRKRVFDPAEPFVETARKVGSGIREGRAGEKTDSDKEVGLLLRLPRPLLDLVVVAGRALDYFNLLPSAMITGDPLYASAFVANLGSVGLAGAYHHLYEHGTIPVFLVVGAYRRIPVVLDDGRIEPRRIATFRYTYDERVEDGFYCARAVARMKELLEHPEALV